MVDAKTTDVTTFDTYGLQFQTVSNYRGTTLANSTKVTTNLNGLSGSTDYDLDGDGTVNQTLSWKKTPLDPLGSVTTAETVKATDAATTLISQRITTVSADQKTTTVKTKIDGDTVDDFVETITIDNAGTQKDEVKQYKALDVRSQAVVTTSDDGLSKTSSSDLDGNGVFELVTTDVTVLNADGSRTETISKSGIGDTLISRTTAKVNASGGARRRVGPMPAARRFAPRATSPFLTPTAARSRPYHTSRPGWDDAGKQDRRHGRGARSYDHGHHRR
ncbi:hypothetical protein ACOJBM_00460 [Rhizobium beringeri]